MKKIENSFVTIYIVTSTSEFASIICVIQINIKLSNFNIYVNGKKVKAFINQEIWKIWMDEDYIFIFSLL